MKLFNFGKAGSALCKEQVSGKTRNEIPDANVSGGEKTWRNAGMAKVLFVMIVLFAAACPVFADEGIPVLDKMGNKIIDLINARWVRALLALALVIEFGVIAFGNVQGEGGMIKKVLPWIIGTAGILGACSIVGFFFKGTTANSNDLMGIGYLIDAVDRIRAASASLSCHAVLG